MDGKPDSIHRLRTLGAHRFIDSASAMALFHRVVDGLLPTEQVDVECEGDEVFLRTRPASDRLGDLLSRTVSSRFIRSHDVNGFSTTESFVAGRPRGVSRLVCDERLNQSTLRFVAEPTFFVEPLNAERVRADVLARARRMLSTAFTFNGERLQFSNLEAAARAVIGEQPLWSPTLFIQSVTARAYTVHLALGLTDQRPARFELRRNQYVIRGGPHLDGVRGALAKAVKLRPDVERAPIDQLAGAMTVDWNFQPRRWSDSAEIREFVGAALVEPLSVYLDSVPEARERLAALWP